MKRSKVLIIDDDEAIRIFLQSVFERDGYNVFLATNGAEGLSLAWQNSFDLIVTDMVMPDLGGAEIVARLRKSGCDVPIVVITGYADGDANLQDIKEYRVDCVLYKPFAAHEVTEAVSRIMDGRLRSADGVQGRQ
jgi:DNA-binding NtrC family response regulator